MDVYRMSKLFQRLMDFFPNEQKVILAVVRSDYFGNRDVELSLIAAKHIVAECYQEAMKQCPIFAEMSFYVFNLFFDGGRISACEDIIHELKEDDINLVFDIFELVVNTEETKDDKFRVVYNQYRAQLENTHEGKALIEELRKCIK